MPRHARLLLSMGTAATLAACLLVVTGPSGASAPADAPAVAMSRLQGDASGRLTLRRTSDGLVDFVGTPAGVRIEDPGVSRSTSIAEAAQSALDRYGPAFGTTRPGTSMSPLGSQPSVTGDTVRYQQSVGGVPVLGGELVVSLAADRSLDSILARTSHAGSVLPATVSEAAARAVAALAFRRSEGAGTAPQVTSLGRWLLDPSLVDLTSGTGVRGAWRFELRRGEDQRRMVLVDDRTGSVLLDADLIERAETRIVCDNNNVARPPATDNDQVPCTDPDTAARFEGDGASGVADVNRAYDASGAVWALYNSLGVDLTPLIGRDLSGGGKALAHTVQMCYQGLCPFENAFWNGVQMYYGAGFVADDVVGHEMTHGVIDRTSALFDWGQSGAINESIADIMGEIADHRIVMPGEQADSWLFAEDWPDPYGPQRSFQNPPALGQPDKTSSPLYKTEDVFQFDFPYPDRDGVHTNSGVGNKTFYLIAQAIDAADGALTKSARLWLLTLQSLASGSGWADLAAVLEQSCASLQNTGAMTAANCAAVHQATLTTELRRSPLNPPRVDARAECPDGSPRRVLFNSESGDTGSKFVAGPHWSRAGIPGWGQNAHSAPSAWSTGGQNSAGSSSLVAASGITLPAGQLSFLFFEHWRLLDYNDEGFHDVGTVEVNGTDVGGPAWANRWVNRPTEEINDQFGNPAGGRLGFGGDSHGYVASRLDLSSFGGQAVRPQFTMNTDFSGSYVGWYVDDVLVYTCDKQKLRGKAKLKGQPFVGRTFRAVAKGWPAGTRFTYRWLRNGKPIKGAHGKRFKIKGRFVGKKIAVAITGAKNGFQKTSVTSKAKRVKRHPPSPPGA